MNNLVVTIRKGGEFASFFNVSNDVDFLLVIQRIHELMLSAEENGHSVDVSIVRKPITPMAED